MSIRRLSVSISLFAIISAAACPMASCRANQDKMTKYVSEKPAFVLYKPQSWSVQQEESADALRVTIKNPQDNSFVEIYFTDNHQRKLDSLKLMGAMMKAIKSLRPDLSASEVMTSRDLSHAVATVTYTRDKIPVKGKLYFQTDSQQAVIRSYVAPAARMEAQRNMLLDILANFHLGGSKSAPVTQTGRGSAVPPAPEPVRVQLVPRRASDGSLSISLPADWSFQGQKGMAIASAPGGKLGFIFTSFQVLPSNYGVQVPANVIVSRYQPPSAFIHTLFNRFRNRNVKVHSAEKDLKTIQEFQMNTRSQCDAEDLIVSWVSPEGAACMGSFKLINSHPNLMGQWYSIVAGTWGPADDQERYLPMLEQIGNSFSINDRYAKNYIQQGLVRLRQLQEQTRRSMQSLNDMRAQNQKDEEARQAVRDGIQAKWDDYNRGNSYWISDMEGGKVYKTDSSGTTDSQTGDRIEGSSYDYVHFEGQNPRHSSETMREVNSYELQKYEEGR